MVNTYSFLSEIMRTGLWMMEPSVFSYYKNMFSLVRLDTEAIGRFRWGEKRTDGSLLIFKPGQQEPESRLIQTQHPDWYPSSEIGKDDQVIHVMPITGAITHGGAACSYGTRELADRFAYADSQDSVTGHLVILDTPGGSAMANDLDEVLANAKKPTVALIRGMNASKGVWISSHIPYVFAERADVEIGCVGVMASIQGTRNGVNQFNEVYYEVYAENSCYKNLEYREAVQNDNVKPMVERLNEMEGEFREKVKARWPDVSEEKLKGRTYKASEVIGEMVDGIKSYADTVDFIFSLAGVDRKQPGTVTRLGVVDPAPNDALEKASSGMPGDQISKESIQPAAGTEEPATADNTNPQTLRIPMVNKELFEKIPGMGTVAVNESGNVVLTEAQNTVLAAYLQRSETAIEEVGAQQETITGLKQELTKKEGVIKELAQATGKPIAQAVPENDNAGEQAVSRARLVTSPNASHYENIGKMRQYMLDNGLIL